MQPSPQVPKWIPWTLAILSFFGFADAAFLSAKHFQGTTPPCVIFSGCDVVTTSSYAVIAGIPVALLGALFYFSVLVLSLVYADRRALTALKIVRAISLPGFLFSLYLIYLQLFVLHAVCIYCMASAVTSTTIFALAFFALRKKKENESPSTSTL